VENPRWFLDELARAGEEHLDPSYVAGYDRKARLDPSEEVALLRDLGLDETHTLVDLGAGTGAVALAAAELCRRVVAVDVSAAMLALATDEAYRRGLDNVECVEQGFLTYEHRGEPADFVYSRNALHHLPDFWKAIALDRRLSAAGRHLSPPRPRLPLRATRRRERGRGLARRRG
jgi:ubiquinone/menaquinone biosynthesis C-methylase UbiE